MNTLKTFPCTVEFVTQVVACKVAWILNGLVVYGARRIRLVSSNFSCTRLGPCVADQV